MGLMGHIMACSGSLWGIPSRLTKSTDHPSRNLESISGNAAMARSQKPALRGRPSLAETLASFAGTIVPRGSKYPISRDSGPQKPYS